MSTRELANRAVPAHNNGQLVTPSDATLATLVSNISATRKDPRNVCHAYKMTAPC
jgi:hypothetical protein